MSPTKFQLPSLVDRSSMEREVGIICGMIGEDLQKRLTASLWRGTLALTRLGRRGGIRCATRGTAGTR